MTNTFGLRVEELQLVGRIVQDGVLLQVLLANRVRHDGQPLLLVEVPEQLVPHVNQVLVTPP